MGGWSKGEKGMREEKIIIRIILSFRKLWGRESWVHQRPFATWVYKVISFNQTERKTSTKCKISIQALPELVSSLVYMICPLSSSQLFPTCWQCKKFGCENISFNCLSLCNKHFFFLFHIFKYSFGEKKKDATLFPLFF